VNAEVVQPYAQAHVRGRSNNLTEQLRSAFLTGLLQNSEELEFSGKPSVRLKTKGSVGARLKTLTLYAQLLMLLVDRRRILLLEEICQQYLAILRD